VVRPSSTPKGTSWWPRGGFLIRQGEVRPWALQPGSPVRETGPRPIRSSWPFFRRLSSKGAQPFSPAIVIKRGRLPPNTR
jgi:hypothetical protein